MNSGHRRRRSTGIGATFDERYEARTLVPRAKQVPRRIPVRWYPTHGYQQEQPSPLQAPSSLMTLALARNHTPPKNTRDPTTKRFPLTVEVISALSTQRRLLSSTPGSRSLCGQSADCRLGQSDRDCFTGFPLDRASGRGVQLEVQVIGFEM